MWFSLLLILSVDLAGSTLENLTHEWLRDALPVLLVVWNNWARKYFSHRRFVGIEFRTAVPTRTSNSNVAKKEFNWKNLGFRNKKCSKGYQKWNKTFHSENTNTNNFNSISTVVPVDYKILSVRFSLSVKHCNRI